MTFGELLRLWADVQVTCPICKSRHIRKLAISDKYFLGKCKECHAKILKDLRVAEPCEVVK